MIIVRSPFRISLGGGGTDLPSYYSLFGSLFVSAAINKYVYISVNTPFENSIIARYSKNEKVTKIDQIKHPIIRETLRLICPDIKSVEISSFADIPSGTGLGSSGSFGTALIKALNLHLNRSISPEETAALAVYIESVILQEPTGKQDQYISSYGGITEFRIDNQGKVEFSPLNLSSEVLSALEENLLLFYTGSSREASILLSDQDSRTKNSDSAIIEELHAIQEIGRNVRNYLEKGDLESFGSLLDEHWSLKRTRSKGMSNEYIDDIYNLGIKSGATGGKLVGAGGGGFLMFCTCDPEQLRSAMKKVGLQELKFRFDFEGTKVVFS